MTTVFVTHPADKLGQYFGPKAIGALEAIAEVRFNPQAAELSTAELVAAAQGCDALIAYRQTPGPESLFRDLPQMAAFVRCAVDIRTVDVEAASRHGVLVTRASPGFVPAVAEWIIGSMIELARGIGRYAHAYRCGEPPAPVMGRQLRAATLGIIGFGAIGRYLGDLGRAFDMRVLVNDPLPIDERAMCEQVSLGALLAQSDFVVCLAPADAQTEKLMNAQAFVAMQPGAFFINAARGELVDDEALLAALESGHLGGAALDVGRAPDQMPLPGLAGHPLVVATPHIGGLTLPAVEHQALETVSQIAALMRGDIPAGAVNPAHASRLARWRLSA